MKANELRIGNLYNHNGEIREVTPSTIEEVWNSKRSWVNPISLTEEWLLKFGFEKNGRDWELPNFRFHVNKPINYNGFVFCDGYTVITEKIQFVHQLQNLYFALTQEELTFKNK